MGRGYMKDEEIKSDYRGLAKLVAATRVAFDARAVPIKTITMAYYPDKRQEALLSQYGIADQVNLMHCMAYDQGSGHHSSLSFGKQTADQGAALLPAHKVTLGLPFYGRYQNSGEWVTYEDIVQVCVRVCVWAPPCLRSKSWSFLSTRAHTRHSSHPSPPADSNKFKQCVCHFPNCLGPC